MEIGSLTFLYFFLPAALIIFNLTPKKFKNIIIAIVSAVFVAFSQPENFLFFAANIFIQFFLSKAMFRFSENKNYKRTVLVFAIILNCASIVFSSVQSQITGNFAPFATMVISFTAIGYFVDIYKGDGEPFSSFADFVVFLAFFGKLLRGPLIRVSDVKELSNSEKFSISETGSGFYLFLRGLAKYVVLSLPLTQLHKNLSAANSEEISTVGAWLGMVVFSMVIFFDLSGFCDIARGLGKCFGMELPKNFYFPFQSPSVSDFLDRFNMTVTGFFRHYVYDVLRNDKNSKPQFIVNTILITMLCGIWFGIRMNFILWGLYIAAFIIIEEFFLLKILRNIPHFFARLYTFTVTMFSMVIFSASDISAIFVSFRAMFGIKAPMITDSVAYIVSQNILVLFVGAFFFISAFSMFIQYLSKKTPRLFGIFAALESMILLTLITAELI